MSPPNDATALRATGVSVVLGGLRVLDGVDLDIMPRTSMVVIGGSGSGKSVLLKCILGLIEPDTGSIAMDGTDITSMPMYKRARREPLTSSPLAHDKRSKSSREALVRGRSDQYVDALRSKRRVSGCTPLRYEASRAADCEARRIVHTQHRRRNGRIHFRIFR